MNSKKVILTYPPVSSPWHLPVGIGYLAGQLEQDGHEVRQRYGHIDGLKHVLGNIDNARTTQALGIIGDSRSSIRDLYFARKALEKVSAAVPTSDKFSVLRNNVIYVAKHYDGTIEGALQGIDERRDSLFYCYFQDEVKHALDFKPHVYGISIADERQFMPGMILAAMIKEDLPETLVVCGGNFWARMDHSFHLPKFDQFLNYCDAIVYREGFKPMEEIVRSLDPEKVPGVVWRQKDRLVINPPIANPIDFESLATPVFAETNQWSPDRVFPLYTMSNCPMKCNYCAISAGSDSHLAKPREMSAKRIAQHMKSIGSHRFDIQDEMFPIQKQLELGKELKRLDHHATWNCYMTVDKRLSDLTICQALYEAGLSGVQLGLESLHLKTLEQESKQWNNPENYAKILSNLAQVGIQVHVFIITGIPEEPLDSNLAWLDFVDKHGKDILTIKSSRYRVVRKSPMAEPGLLKNSSESARKQLDVISSDRALVEFLPDQKPLHLNLNFAYKNKEMSGKRVDAMRDLHEQMCREHWAYGVTSTIPWWINRGRFTLEELRSMAMELATYHEEDNIQNLPYVLSKVRGLIRHTQGQEINLRSYSDVVRFTSGTTQTNGNF